MAEQLSCCGVVVRALVALEGRCIPRCQCSWCSILPLRLSQLPTASRFRLQQQLDFSVPAVPRLHFTAAALWQRVEQEADCAVTVVQRCSQQLCDTDHWDLPRGGSWDISSCMAALARKAGAPMLGFRRLSQILGTASRHDELGLQLRGRQVQAEKPLHVTSQARLRGDKGATLAKMASLGRSVLPGFALTIEASACHES